MVQSRFYKWIPLFLSASFLIASVCGDEDGVHHLHSAKVHHKDGSSSEAISATSTSKGGASPSSLPDFLRSLNLQIPTENEPVGSASDSIASSISTATNNNNGVRNVPIINAPPYPYAIPPTVAGPLPPTGYPFLPWGVGTLIPPIDVGVGVGPGFGVGLVPYYPIIEKVMLIIGGGILLLVMIAMLKGTLEKGGFLNNLGESFYNSMSGAGAMSAGPVQASAAGSAAMINDPNFNKRVMDGTERKW